MGSHRRRDLAFAVGIGFLVLAWTGAVGRAVPADRPLDAGGYLLVSACAVALVWRRDAPLPVLAATTVCTTGYLSVGYPYGPMLVLLAIAVYTVARHLPWRTAVPAALLALGVLLVHLLFNDAALPGALGLIPASAWVAVPFAIGSTVASIEAGRRAAVERGIADERLRVAQEVHDVVGHGLAAIKVQADVALHLLDKRPEQARPALETVSRTSAQALDELRSTLGMVRGTPQASAGPGIADLDALYQRMREAGLRVHVDVLGTPAPLAPSAELAAYRVVQEAMTNVLKHADRKEAAIVIDHRDDGAHLEIASPHTDRLPTPNPSGSAGMGLTGMQERVLAQRGRFGAGPEPDGGFVVRAWLVIGALLAFWSTDDAGSPELFDDPDPGSSDARPFPRRVIALRDDRWVLLDPREIRFAETDRDNVWLATDQGRLLAAVRGLDRLEQELSGRGFLRVHRRFLVNLGRVREIEPGFKGALFLATDTRSHETVPVARRHVLRVRQALGP